MMVFLYFTDFHWKIHQLTEKNTAPSCLHRWESKLKHNKR